MTNISKIKMYYNIFFKNFLSKFILASRVKGVTSLKLWYKKENLDFQDKNLKRGEYYYNLDKRKSRSIIIVDKLPLKKRCNNCFVSLSNILALNKLY